MYYLNKAQVIGNVTRKPELRTTTGGQTLCTLSVATNRRWKDQSSGDYKEDVEFHNIVCWGKLAEIANQYLDKGKKVFMEGRLQTRTWDDEAGVKHYRTEIVAQDLIILSPNGENGGTSATSPTPEVDEITDQGEDLSDDMPF